MRYTTSSRWHYAQSWSTCPEKYNYVGIVSGKTSNQLQPTVYRSVSGESAKRNLKNFNGSNYDTYLLTRDSFNRLLNSIKSGLIKEDFDISKMTPTSLVVAEQKRNIIDKIVHVAWNTSRGDVLWASEDVAECIAKATKHATLYPTEQLIILSPVKKIFQPANVTVEDM